MSIETKFKSAIKDSNNNVVTLEVEVTAYWTNNDKVYNETFMWNPPFDKRIPFSKFPKVSVAQRKNMSEEQLTEQLKIDDIMCEWHLLLDQDSQYQNHLTQADLKVQLEPLGESVVGEVVLAK